MRLVRPIAPLVLSALMTWATYATADAPGRLARGGGVLWHQAPGSLALPSRPEIPMWAAIRSLPASTVRLGEVVQFPVLTNRVGYAHLIVRNPDGSYLVVAVNQRLVAGQWQTIRVGRSAQLVARRPLGRTQVTLLVTTKPIDRPAYPGISVTELKSMLATIPPSSWTIARTHVDVAS